MVADVSGLMGPKACRPVHAMHSYPRPALWTHPSLRSGSESRRPVARFPPTLSVASQPPGLSVRRVHSRQEKSLDSPMTMYPSFSSPTTSLHSLSASARPTPSGYTIALWSKNGVVAATAATAQHRTIPLYWTHSALSYSTRAHVLLNVAYFAAFWRAPLSPHRMQRSGFSRQLAVVFKKCVPNVHRRRHCALQQIVHEDCRRSFLNTQSSSSSGGGYTTRPSKRILNAVHFFSEYSGQRDRRSMTVCRLPRN